MTIAHEEGVLTRRLAPGPSLYFISTAPKVGTVAWVGLLHGYADHAARYTHVMDAWAAKGLGSIAIDMRGHGRAQGRRGYCAQFEEYLDDTAELARLVYDRAAGAPCFLFGHSFGGLVATLSVLEAPRSWRGLVLSAPFFDLAFAVPRAKKAAGRLASLALPWLPFPSGLHGADLTHDAAKARAYEEDPLVFSHTTARWFFETRKAQRHLETEAGDLKLPLYLEHGTRDPVSSVTAGRKFFDAVGSRDKTYDARAGLFHESLNEPEWPDISDAMANWMVERTS